MKNYHMLAALLAFFSILLQAHAGSTSVFFPDLFKCSSLFQGYNGLGNTGPTLVSKSLIQASSYSTILLVSAMIILMVFIVVGLVYAIGFSFGIEKLKTIAKSEMLEGLVNLIIIVLILAGPIALYPGVAFIANIATLGSSGAAAPSGGPLSAMTALYTSTCTNIYTNFVYNALYNDYLGVVENLIYYHTLSSISINLAPNYFGLTFAPFGGAKLIQTTLWIQESSLLTVGVMGISMIILLLFIYFFIPIFLYLGIILRSIPWTRAAGGTLIALFISFYIIFPAIVYGISVVFSSPYSPICNAPHAVHVKGKTPPTGPCSPTALVSDPLTEITKFLFTVLSLNLVRLNSQLLNEIGTFIKAVSFLGFQAIGFVMAIIICYDILEILGDLLGAPSLQSSKVLSKMI